MPCNKVVKAKRQENYSPFLKQLGCGQVEGTLTHCVAVGKSRDFFASQSLQQFNWKKADWMAVHSNIQYAADGAAERSIPG